MIISATGENGQREGIIMQTTVLVTGRQCQQYTNYVRCARPATTNMEREMLCRVQERTVCGKHAAALAKYGWTASN